MSISVTLQNLTWCSPMEGPSLAPVTQPRLVIWMCPGLWITCPYVCHSLISHHPSGPIPWLTPWVLQEIPPSHSLFWFPAFHSPTSPCSLLLVLKNTACVSFLWRHLCQPPSPPFRAEELPWALEQPQLMVILLFIMGCLSRLMPYLSDYLLEPVHVWVSSGCHNRAP